MNYQPRAFRISFLLHTVIIVLVIFGSTFLKQYEKMVVLDFDLLKSVPEVKKVEESAPAPLINTNLIPPPARQTLKKEEAPGKSSDQYVPPIVKLPEAISLEGSPMGEEISDQGKSAEEGSPGISGGINEGSGTNSGMGNGDVGQESAGTKYLREHFDYIRNNILRNVSYPDPARRKGWQGKVLLSFIIKTDGSVRSLKVIQSSGFAMLDKSAIETVRYSAPFPKPPGEAQIVIPIVYNLE